MSALSNVDVVPVDISVAGRVLAAFPEKLKPEQRVPNNLAYLGQLCANDPTCSIIKLPNISAPLNQLTACITELRSKGYDVPMYPLEPSTDEEIDIQNRYKKLMGSAVNPVLREGNSDRRAAPPVKAYAQKNPHRMGLWSRASKSHVAHMDSGDFYGNEIAISVPKATTARIEHHASDGTVTVLNPKVKLDDNEVIDASYMSVKALQEFYKQEIKDALDSELLLSLHLKATMMKVSDPIMFGHCIRAYFKAAYEKHGATLESIGANPGGGLASIFETVNAKLPGDEAKKIIADFDACYEDQPWLAMVNSDKGITNLHAPNDIIIDASMPVVIRDSGKMWNKMGELEDTKCIIPDRCYATMYQEVISYVKTKGQFDVSTMGSVANVGLMAQKAEEYGSHDKTFELAASGSVKVVDEASGAVLLEHNNVEKGDIWRMCQTKDIAIRDWVKLAVTRARATGNRTIFWLDKKRGHDRVLVGKVRDYLEDHDTSGLDISILRPSDAVRISMELASEGKDTISVTGNVLRDYLTDLFPILELGTSAKMLSIVPLIKGGGLYETGAGGSAPKHVEQFIKEGHLRWDSLGEYLALAVCFERLAEISGNPKAKNLGECLNKAVGRILNNRKSPSRSVNQIDNRATNFYIALYWADFLQQLDPAYKNVYEELSAARADVVEEFKVSQGQPVDLGGYYLFDSEKASKAMNPSKTLNKIMASFGPEI
jgi:isocitrate dehydrogenase